MPDDSYYIVTNRHVVDQGFDRGKSASHVSLISATVSGFTTDFNYFIAKISSPEAAFTADPFEDIAAIRVKDFVVQPNFKVLSINAIPYDHLADEEYFSGLNCGDFISMPGYPEWYDRAAQRPILRSGTLASDPSTPYSGPDQEPVESRRLIEAFSFGGSSGSPVFALGYGSTPGSDILISNSRSVKLVGINAGHLKVGGSGGHSGLSFMFTSTSIARLLLENAKHP